MTSDPTSTAAGTRKQRGSTLRRREAVAGWLFVSPWVVGLLIFTAYPVIATFYLSFTDFGVIGWPHWIGLDNYNTMFNSDPDFWNSVTNSAYYAGFSVVLGLVASLGLALVMNLPAKGIGVYRTLIYLPSLAPPVAATLVFVLLLDSNNGLINVGLSHVGIQGPAWLFDQSWTKPALVMMSLWGVGTGAMIFLAGLQEVPQSMLEAAMVDGANTWQRFTRITLPLLSPVILFNLVMGIVGSFQVFSQALVVGGPSGDPVGSTLMLMVLIYRTAFNQFQMGYAAAQSVFLFVVVVVLTVIVFRVSGRLVYYEGDNRAA